MRAGKDLNESQIQSLACLLQDEDAEIVRLTRRKLGCLSSECVSFLQNSADSNESPEIRQGAHLILENLRFTCLEDQLNGWKVRQEPHHLEEGACLLAAFAYPGLSFDTIHNSLDEMADEVRQRWGETRDSCKMWRVLSDFFFRELGFRGNHERYYDPDNSYLNRVLERKVGIPISLSVVLLALAERLSLPLVGIGMPGHFLLKYEGLNGSFFVDAFNQGRMLSHQACRKWLEEGGYGFKETYLAPVRNEDILARMIRNLIPIYTKTGDENKAVILTDYLDIFEQHLP